MALNYKTSSQRLKELYHYTNDKLTKKLDKLELLAEKIRDKAWKCPHCKDGCFIVEDNGGEYWTYESWLECDKCGANPSPYRKQMIEDTDWDPHWDLTLYEYMRDFCDPDRYEFDIPTEKRRPFREFNPEEWNKESHKFYVPNSNVQVVRTWNEFVEIEIADHVKHLLKTIENAKKYKCLQRILENDRKNTQNHLLFTGNW